MATRQSSRHTLALVAVVLFPFVCWNIYSNKDLLLSHYSAITDSGSKYFSSLSSDSAVTTSMAATDSLGFFDDVPDDLWKVQKQIAQARQHIHIPNTPLHPAKRYYQQNWDPDFSCAAEEKCGAMGDGHKWLCDPHRIASQKECIVYSVGSNGDFSFEAAIQKLLPQCEIHVFDFSNFAYRVPKSLNITYHVWGLKPVQDENITVTKSSPWVGNTLWRSKPELDWKTFPEIVSLLGHTGKVIDIFKIDCEGCEFYTYKDWFEASAEIRQILVEVHGTPNIVNTFFSHIRSENYVMFHKEPNIEWSDGNCEEFSFLKMSSSFFG